MFINKLSKEQFEQYFTPPMQLVSNVEDYSGIPIKDYVKEIIEVEKIYTTLENIEIPYLYVDEAHNFEHLIISYGKDNHQIIIVTNFKEVIGYYLLNLQINAI